MSANQDKTIAAICLYSAWGWAKLNNLSINGEPFSIEDHPYQQITMEREVYDKDFKLVRRKRKVCRKWAAQVGKTFGHIIHELHHLVYGFYPKGAMFIFPNTGLVERFSKSRFTPLIEDNAFLRQHIRSTDTIELKRVSKSNLYFVGGKVLQKIAGEQKTSAAVKSEPVDSINFDELDEIDPDIIILAHDRIGHSEIKYESYTGTPSIPDYGIDKLYSSSNQMVWHIKCGHCGVDTCLELEFPECIHQEKQSGRWYRACRKCGKEILTINGRWIPQFRDREMEGTWISRLNLADKYVNLGDILERYANPPNGNKGFVMNGDLGMAYIEAENRLTANELLSILGRDPMLTRHPGPTAMGVDLGNDFHVVILDKASDKSVRMVRACQLSSNHQKDFSPLHDLIKQYNVRTMVIDMQFAQSSVRRFIEDEKSSGCEIFGNFYQDNYRGVVNWDSKERIVREDRTEICDNTHDLIVSPGRLILPRNSEVMGDFIKHMCNLARVPEEDRETGSKHMRYRKLGPDHYRHALNYAYLASKRVGVYVPQEVRVKRGDQWDMKEKASTNWMAA